MPIRINVYHQGKETLVAAADADLIGKTFREGKFKIEVGKLYAADAVTEERFATEPRLATLGNFVGKETIDAAKEAGFVADDGILWINGGPPPPFRFMILRGGVPNAHPAPAAAFSTASRHRLPVFSSRGRSCPFTCCS